jgi:hypothetical protein
MPNRTILILVIGFGLAALLAWWRPTPVRLRPPARGPETAQPTAPVRPERQCVGMVRRLAAMDYYATSPRRNPTGPAQGLARAHRGGGWSNAPRNLRVANRNRSLPTVRNSTLGFRLAM